MDPSIPRGHPLADKLRLVIGSFENHHPDVARFINEDFGVAIENLPLPAHALQGLEGCELHTIMGGISKDAVDGDDELWSAMMAFSHNVRVIYPYKVPEDAAIRVPVCDMSARRAVIPWVPGYAYRHTGTRVPWYGVYITSVCTQ